MPAFAVLLRGVNVGKGNRVPMAALRELLEARGGSDVRTLLNSGNAVFHGAADSVDDVAAAYLDCAAGIRDSRAAGALLGKAGRAVTTRNWATVLKLKGLLDARADPASRANRES